MELMMDRLAAMRVFVAVVDAQGFSAASRTLSMPLATVSRKVIELEAHLGSQLLIRSALSDQNSGSFSDHPVIAENCQNFGLFMGS